MWNKHLAPKAILLACLSASLPATASAQCPPVGWTRGELLALKSNGFEMADDARRRTLALELLPCLADADPELRDGIAFEAYSTWLRGDRLDQATRITLLARVLPALDPKARDAAGFRQPFSALLLSELARADRKAAYLTPGQRQALVEAGAHYLESVDDYRGFDEKQGWRHGVAHGADLLMQLSLNGQLDKAQLERMLAAIRTQVAPPGGHFYIYGEPERLARPVLFAAMRGLVTTEEWKAWFGAIAASTPPNGWDQAFRSNMGLARRHDTRAFLLAIKAEVVDSKDERLAALAPIVSEALAAVP